MKTINSLVVEDNEITLKIMQNILEDYGPCETAGDGLKGLEKVKQAAAGNIHFDLICLDIQMPNSDGIELLERIRLFEQENQIDKKSIIIMATVFGGPEIIKKCVGLGCNSFLLKPVDKNNLSKILKRHKII